MGYHRIHLRCYRQQGIAGNGKQPVILQRTVHFFVKSIEVEPVNGLRNCDQVKLLISKVRCFCPFCLIDNVGGGSGVFYLLFTEIGSIYSIKMSSELYRKLAVARTTIPGSFSLPYFRHQELN